MNLLEKFKKNLLVDKTLLAITILLMLLSLVTVFSSTALTNDVIKGTADRWHNFMEQLSMICFCAVIIVGGITVLMKVEKASWGDKFLKWVSGASLIVAIVMSLMLGLGIGVDPRLADRALKIFGMQVNVAEVLKFALIFALIGLGQKYKKEDTPLFDYLIERYEWCSFLEKRIWQRFILLYAPALLCIGCVLHGGFSSALFLAVMSYIVFSFSIEKGPRRTLLAFGLSGVILLIGGVSLMPYSVLEGHGRMPTVKARVMYYINGNADINRFEKGSAAYNDMVEYVRQIEGAKKAIHEGGVFGVGAGQSKQKYKVAAMHNDFLFSFICEEYGIFGGAFIILIFLVISMRCKFLSKYLKDPFEKVTLMIFGFLITLQAFMHIAVNLSVVPMTGQALPLLSSGNSALLAFSMIICVVLYLSGKALRLKNEKENAPAQAAVAVTEDTLEKITDDESDN